MTSSSTAAEEAAPGGEGGTAEEPAAPEAMMTIRAPPGCRIYFAYGSNVNTKTMMGVRGINPSASYPSVLPKYKLVFNVPGLPYVDPGFASVKAVNDDEEEEEEEEEEEVVSVSVSSSSSSSTGDEDLSRYEREVHGVAYVVTDEEWKYILRTETSYLTREVTLMRCVDDAPIAATTLVYPDVDVGAELLPSARYLGLLREGAEEWNLDVGWRRYLNEVVAPYDASDQARMMGGAVAAASLAPLAALTAPLGIAVAVENMRNGAGGSGGGADGDDAAAGAGVGQGGVRDGGELAPSLESVVEEVAVQGFKALAGFTWGVHNALWAPVFGSGANNDEVKR